MEPQHINWNHNFKIMIHYVEELLWFYGSKPHFQQYFNYIVAVSFIGGEAGGPGENTNLSQVTDKLYHIMLYI